MHCLFCHMYCAHLAAKMLERSMQFLIGSASTLSVGYGSKYQMFDALQWGKWQAGHTRAK